MRVKISRLAKHFGNTRAVDGISFEFGEGQIFGFIGPNGAGKTTTIRILATLEDPTSGNAYVDGVSVVEYPEKARRLTGYVPDTLPSQKEISVHEYLDFFARSYRLPRKQRLEVLESIEDFTRLTDIREKMVADLSKGMKQRVSLARALVHDPPVLIMDEPASGLDPRARVELRELLKVLAGQGKAILISSHILTELAEICTGAVIIEQGKLLMAGTMDELLQQASAIGQIAPDGQDRPQQVLLIRSLGDQEQMHRELLEMPYVKKAFPAGKEVEVELEGGDERCADLLCALVQKGHRIVEFKQRRAGLEEIFMKVTRGEVQ